MIPIFDRVVDAELQPPPSRYWSTLRGVLADAHLREQVERLRPAHVDERVSTLRLLDVAVWMTGSQSTNAKRVRENAR